MTIEAKVTSVQLSQETSPTKLAIYAVKTGNLPILKLILNSNVVFKYYAQADFKRLETAGAQMRRDNRLKLLTEIVIECIKDEELRSVQNNKEINQERLKKDISFSLQEEKRKLLKEFRQANIELSEEKYDRLFKNFQQELSSDFLRFPWEGFSSQKQMRQAREKLEKDVEMLKKRLTALMNMEISIQYELRELKWQFDEMRYEIANNIKKQIESYGLDTNDLLSANVALHGVYDEDAYDLVHLAIEFEQKEVLKFLLECQVDIEKEFVSAIQQGKVSVVKELLSLSKLNSFSLKESLNRKDHNGDTFLHHAMRHALATDNYSFVIQLIENGAYLFESNESKVTPWDIANDFCPINKAAKYRHTGFLYDMAYAMLIERKINCSQSFSGYQKDLLNLFESQYKAIIAQMKNIRDLSIKKIAQKQLEIIDDLLFVLAQSHGKADDNLIHDAIIKALNKFPVILDHENLGEKLTKYHKIAFKMPGYAFNVVENLIRENEERMSVYSYNTQFFPFNTQGPPASSFHLSLNH